MPTVIGLLGALVINNVTSLAQPEDEMVFCRSRRNQQATRPIHLDSLSLVNRRHYSGRFQTNEFCVHRALYADKMHANTMNAGGKKALP